MDKTLLKFLMRHAVFGNGIPAGVPCPKCGTEMLWYPEGQVAVVMARAVGRGAAIEEVCRAFPDTKVAACIDGKTVILSAGEFISMREGKKVRDDQNR